MTCVYEEYEVKTKMVQDQLLQLNMKFFEGVILRENFSKWGEGMSKFLGSQILPKYVQKLPL